MKEELQTSVSLSSELLLLPLFRTKFCEVNNSRSNILVEDLRELTAPFMLTPIVITHD